MNILYASDLAKVLGKTTEALRSMRVRNPNNLPAPDGRIGKRDYWLPERVEQWLKSGGSKQKRRGRPRLVPVSHNTPY
jgi:hypothetical protein